MIIKVIPCYVRRGRNAGREGGRIIYDTDEEPYYYIRKNYKLSQMWKKTEFLRFLNISKDIIDKDLIIRNIKKVKAEFWGYEKEPFTICIPLKDFIEYGKIDNYDDEQYSLDWSKYISIYNGQKKLVY